MAGKALNWREQVSGKCWCNASNCSHVSAFNMHEIETRLSVEILKVEIFRRWGWAVSGINAAASVGIQAYKDPHLDRE